jgi:PPM family protein phosphatase
MRRNHEAAGSRRALDVRVSARTDVGRVRDENQDRISRFHCPLGEVFLVVDGMGGHRGGAMAAETVVEVLERSLRQVDAGTQPATALRDAARQSHQAVQAKAGAEEELDGMGATGVLALVRDAQVLIAHLGDSRAYLFRGSSLLRLTRDHTLVQKLVDDGMLSEEQAREHPDANVVSRAFGRSAEVDLEVSPPLDLAPGDRLVLCSDGLSGAVDDSAIERVVASTGPGTADGLIELALAAGGDDNVSVQVLTFGEPVPAADLPAPAARSLTSAGALAHGVSRLSEHRDGLLIVLGACGMLLFLLAAIGIATARGLLERRPAATSLGELGKGSSRSDGPAPIAQAPHRAKEDFDRGFVAPEGPDGGPTAEPLDAGGGAHEGLRSMLPPPLAGGWFRSRPLWSAPSGQWEIYFEPAAEAWVEPVAKVLTRSAAEDDERPADISSQRVELLLVVPPGPPRSSGGPTGARLFASPGAERTVAALEDAFGLRGEPMRDAEDALLGQRLLVVRVAAERHIGEGS